MLRQKSKKSPTGDMTIIEHLNELRRRILVAFAAIFIGTILGYVWYGTTIGPIPSLGYILRQPYCALPEELRLTGTGGQCGLLATSPFGMFVLRLKVGALAGIVFSSPFWIGQIWGYITPGLKKNEKRWAVTVGLSAGSLFLVGAVLAWFVLYFGLEFLMTLGQEAQIAALTGEDYFSFVIGLLLLFGVSFEVPLLTVLLNRVGVIRYQQLKDKRRYIIVALFIFAAFMTPGQDPLSMVILALCLCLMMEIATQICRIHDKRQEKKQQEWLNVEDTASSAIDTSTPIETPARIDSTTPSGSTVADSTVADPITSFDTTGIHVTQPPRSRSSARPHVSAPQQDSQLHSPRPDYGDGGFFDDVL